ncbi:MAG: carbohydrate kinase [Ruminococcus sp.]|nr:carbohydrate kinase [Ruminococcus sp.]
MVTLGEAVVDFTYSLTEDGIFYKQNPGGSPANIAAAAKILGIPSAYIGKIGTGVFGSFLYETLLSIGIDTSGIIQDKDRLTALAFIKPSPSGKRDFTFYRENSADKNLRFSEINLHLIDTCKILHFGALLLESEPSRSAVTNTVEYAKEKGKIISYSLNFRQSLWSDTDTAASVMRTVLSYVDILKVSEDELELLSDSSNLLPSIYKLMKFGIKVIIVTQGAKGCVIATKKGIREVRSFKTPIVDTLGSGDSFMGAFLTKISKNPSVLDGEDADSDANALTDFALYANAAGAVCASRVGAIPAMPTDDEILRCIADNPVLY